MRAIHLWAFANHIGFPLQTTQDYVDLHPKLVAAVEVGYRTPAGDYLVWRQGKATDPDYFGPEISIHVDKDNQLVGVMPFFRGHGDMMMGVGGPVPIADGSPLDGRLYAWLNPSDQAKIDSGTPCALDTPYLANFPEFRPHVWNYAVTAFPVEPLLIRRAGVAQAAPGDMPDQSFVPIGLFPPDGVAPQNHEPQPYARFSGIVADTRVMTNPLTGVDYQWALVETLGGTIDVVAHAEMAPEPIHKGDVLGGIFWVVADQYEPDNS
jgi:hypothetical protein